MEKSGQIVPNAQLSGSADVYSLGLTLLDATTLDQSEEFYNVQRQIDDRVIQTKLDHTCECYSPEFVDLIIRMIAK